MVAEAEKHLLGALLSKPDLYLDVLDIVATDHFSQKSCRLVYKAVQAMHERDSALDISTLTRHLQESGVLGRIGGDRVLVEWLEGTPIVENAVAYAQTIRRDALLRRIKEASAQVLLVHDAPQTRNEQELIDGCYQAVHTLENVTARANPVTDAGHNFDEVIAQMEAMVTMDSTTLLGKTTGFARLDGMTSGWQPGQLIVVAGRPGMGKTSFAASSVKAALDKHSELKVLFFSLEMSHNEMLKRMISLAAKVPYHSMRPHMPRAHFERVRKQSADIQRKLSRLLLCDRAALTPSHVRLLSRRCKQQHPELGLIVLDYLQLMSSDRPTENRTQAITEISGSLKALARDLEVPVMALAQLNREPEKGRSGGEAFAGVPMPHISHLRDSGAIEQDADIILFPLRPLDDDADEVYIDRAPPEGSKSLIVVAKHRNGPTGKVQATYHKEIMHFHDVQATWDGHESRVAAAPPPAPPPSAAPVDF